MHTCAAGQSTCVPTRTGSIVVDHDVITTWSACAAIERLPEYVAGIESCRMLPDGRQEWVGRAFGIERIWRSEWVERTPYSRIAWHTDDPMVPDGDVTVEPVGDDQSRVTITMHYEPQTMLDRVLVNPAATRLRLAWDLRCFRRWLDEDYETSEATDEASAPAAGAASNADSSALPSRSIAGRDVGSS
jgi:uncharacterized membrane protein